jgi:hypothetical protein
MYSSETSDCFVSRIRLANVVNPNTKDIEHRPCEME